MAIVRKSSQPAILVESGSEEKISDLTAITLPAAADLLVIVDDTGGTAVTRSITHDDALFGASGTPSTQAHDDSAAKGSALDAARSDHKHAMPSAGGGTEAAQSDMEDLGTTNANRFVSPEVAQFHPGVAKAWVKYEQTGTHGIEASHNVASVADGGAVGDTDILWATDFSSGDYCLTGMCQSNGTLGHTAVASTGCTIFSETVDGAAFDGIDNMVVAFGDQ